MIQLILHLIGDYLMQSDWMAQNKTKAFWPAYVHATVYALPFLMLPAAWHHHELPFVVILLTHFLIDRYRLARYVVWAKNLLGPTVLWDCEVYDKGRITADKVWHGWARTPPFYVCKATGYPPSRPDWLAVWLLIIADNTLHLAINYAALRWL